MTDLAALLDNVTALTPLAIALIAVAGLVVGIAPSSFPLLSVAAGFAAGRGATDLNKRSNDGLWLSAGFALGIATMDAVVGGLFGLVGFAVLRALASVMAIAYGLLAIVLVGSPINYET